MRNNASQISLTMAGICFLGFVYELALSRTDWVATAVFLGFSFMFLAFVLVFEFLFDLEAQFVQLTKILSETFMQLAKIDQQREAASRSTNFTFSYHPSGSTVNWNGLNEDTRLDLLSLDQLEEERKKAEKEENYEKAARIQKKIEERKSAH